MHLEPLHPPRPPPRGQALALPAPCRLRGSMHPRARRRGAAGSRSRSPEGNNASVGMSSGGAFARGLCRVCSEHRLCKTSLVH